MMPCGQVVDAKHCMEHLREATRARASRVCGPLRACPLARLPACPLARLPTCPLGRLPAGSGRRTAPFASLLQRAARSDFHLSVAGGEAGWRCERGRRAGPPASAAHRSTFEPGRQAARPPESCQAARPARPSARCALLTGSCSTRRTL